MRRGTKRESALSGGCSGRSGYSRNGAGEAQPLEGTLRPQSCPEATRTARKASSFEPRSSLAAERGPPRARARAAGRERSRKAPEILELRICGAAEPWRSPLEGPRGAGARQEEEEEEGTEGTDDPGWVHTPWHTGRKQEASLRYPPRPNPPKSPPDGAGHSPKQQAPRG
ncbi:unnamed protein product [Prorocentrum cordatum]|uniref:Uncharacterized protein n=1 Tax=Prorocentrum cordatum TaxID=2364126 RepID=A0ABN9T6K0_9DINO|nr:unnamed protein product [Polarella glacialis]